MDAMRLIGATRHALAQAGSVQDVVAEAWQVHALAEAIGGHLAVNGPAAARAEARGLCEAGCRARGALHHPALHHPAVRNGGMRAVQLTEVRDVRRVLLALGELLGDAGIALVGIASNTEEEALYWQCVESIDAADESRDRVRGILRHLERPLEVWEHGGAA
ncbi:DUF6099 family protein [Streptomyces sp. LX-29]|uniref:DUF6099 family protein n=1 Tax=Streptomyces sp. LX-29 TaxID=2900152 RepID=UPI00240E3406|nr:DUF6099 family protein [Streptomyces sp. LX-29]WFB06975.1 DUF6099 family protein [Streptomyces sp. LX-29]